MSNLIINGVSVVPPKSFQVGVQDVDGETGRNANGDMVRDRITTKRKLEIEWGMLTQSECSAILSAVSAVFFSVSYPDPISGQSTRTFYVGDRTAPAYSFTNKFKPWSGLKFNLIER
ncbi:hypothetical protein OIY87_03780 [Streptococcus gallolyticus]|uniref:DUF6711 family protein n=1 Tax=Streptococcus gallolyticus TaxID=315405 RepID=UPI0022B6DD51|nr:DUF6711 family protein [Streptococcus gallolyticus]WAW99478.1 hypothetical protein OIY87_03780 [Streptococcus gallolyticus]